MTWLCLHFVTASIGSRLCHFFLAAMANLKFSLVLLALIPLAAAGFTVRIDDNIGKDNRSVCLENQLLPCQTLDFVSKELLGNCSKVKIYIMSDRLLIGSTISFENCSSLLISSDTSSTPTITCTNELSGSGFQFKNVTNLTLSYLKINSCGYDVNFIPFHSRSALHLHQCVHVAVANVTVPSQPW